TDKPLTIKDGRFGPYVTDGESNASLRRGQTPESMTIEQASEMLSEKRAAGPKPRKAAAKKTTAKKAAPRKAAAKKSAPRKAAAKKAAPRKRS
ncbi:MAG TPA: topoisomerase C-terminal repeat-containing protein, partial [Micromonosporaceae bacterium]|nr:topoisomerase C-terminal repeat-containing protein [Micromonosporaceae bacterium]